MSFDEAAVDEHADSDSYAVPADEQVSRQSHPYYCPGCGARYNYQRECTGRAEAPHSPIEVVSTDELNSDSPDDHTPAPNTGT